MDPGGQFAIEVRYCGALNLLNELRGMSLMYEAGGEVRNIGHGWSRTVRFLGAGIAGDVFEIATTTGVDAGCWSLWLRLQGLDRGVQPWRIWAPQADDPARCRARPDSMEAKVALAISPCDFASYGRFPAESSESLQEPGSSSPRIDAGDERPPLGPQRDALAAVIEQQGREALAERAKREAP